MTNPTHKKQAISDPMLRVLKYLLDEMLYTASLQGETQLIHRIFSH